VTLPRPKGGSNREYKAHLNTGGVLSTRPQTPRIGALTELQSDIAVWSNKTNAKQCGVDWQFRIENGPPGASNGKFTLRPFRGDRAL
jgi:hypothetical protein